MYGCQLRAYKMVLAPCRTKLCYCVAGTMWLRAAMALLLPLSEQITKMLLLATFPVSARSPVFGLSAHPDRLCGWNNADFPCLLFFL